MKTKLPPQNFVRTLGQKRENNYLKKIFVTSRSRVCTSHFSEIDKENIVVEGQSGENSIGDICVREGITPAVFYKWTQEFIGDKNKNLNKSRQKKYFSDDDKFRIVLEGNNGEYSIAEICKRENITQEQFLAWSNNFLKIKEKRKEREKENDFHTKKSRELIEGFVGEETLKYFESFIDVTNSDTLVVNNPERCSTALTFNSKKNLVCLSRSNDVRYLNKYFERINENLPVGGIFIGCFETLTARRERLKINKIPLLGKCYLGGEFVIKRVLPKVSFTKKHYFNLTKGKNRLLSKAECLGRLVCSGFKIMDYKSINGLVYFVVKKVAEPKFDMNPSYGPVYRMPRKGKNGKIIKVYKFRTMHPYSEYLQEYMVKANGYSKSGKPANDFRIPKWGKIMRKYWLDELPQLINVARGEMKLVGVRPLSMVRFRELPKEMQKLRNTQKPGCIPPYIALNRDSDVDSLILAEKDYIKEKIKNPYTTDTKYFFKAIFNIIFRHKRSA